MHYRTCHPSHLYAALFSLIILASIHTGAFASASFCPTCLPNFAAPRTILDGPDVFDLASGDFNGDGRADLAATRGDDVLIMLGDGAGNFGAPRSFSAGTAARDIAVGDFNRDGRADLAVSNVASKNISILLGDGAGNFSAPANIAAADTPTSLVAADFNGDGKLDLAVNVGPFCAHNTEDFSFCSSNTLSVFPGDGAGGFGAPQS